MNAKLRAKLNSMIPALFPGENRVVRALIQAMLNHDPVFLSHIRLQKVVLKTAKAISEMPPVFFILFKLTLFLIEFIAPFRYLHRFSKLPIHRQLHYLKAWEAHWLPPIRNLFKLVRAICINETLSEHPLLESIGYGDGMLKRMKDSPCSGKSAARHLETRDASRFTKNIDESYDVIVIGSGAGGAVTAKELAEGGLRVAIIEEGGYHRTHRDLAYSAIHRLYREKGITSTLGSPIIVVPMGKCFGGTTVVNSGTCFRVPPQVFNHWRHTRGLETLDPQEFSDIYQRVEREIHVEPSDFKVMSRANTLTHELLKKEGYTGNPLMRNIRDCRGCGMCCYGCETGAKQSMDVSYLPKALAAGATAYTHARVTQITTNAQKDHHVTGVIAEAVGRDSKPTGIHIHLKAPRVVLAAGAFFTPTLLKKSGLARGNHHVGRHLTIHPATKVFAEFDEVINGWEGTPQAYYLDRFHSEGILFEGIFTPPDIAGMTVPLLGDPLVQFMKNYRHMVSFGIMISDETEGRIVDLPLMGTTALYSLNRQDAKKFRKAVAFLSRLYLKNGAKKVIPLIRGWIFESLADVDRFEATDIPPSSFDCMGFHPLGTARMARAPEEGVCGPDHQVFGTPGLFIADGSVIPSSLGVNPQLTIMAFATRLSGQILGKRLK